MGSYSVLIASIRNVDLFRRKRFEDNEIKQVLVVRRKINVRSHVRNVGGKKVKVKKHERNLQNVQRRSKTTLFKDKSSLEAVPSKRTTDSFSGYTCDEMRHIARINDLKGFSKLRKHELEAFLEEKLRGQTISVSKNKSKEMNIERKQIEDFDVETIKTIARRGNWHSFPLNFNKYDMIKFLKKQKSFESEFQRWKDEAKIINNELPEDAKYIIRGIGTGIFGSMDISKLNSLVGKDMINFLIEKKIIKKKILLVSPDKTKYFYDFINYDMGRRVYYDHEDLFEGLKPPTRKLMTKTIPDNFIEGMKKIVRTNREYSFGIDFERDLKQPQTFIALQGAENFTYRLTDFEMGGHSHPGRFRARPSIQDLRGLEFGKPRFIISDKPSLPDSKRNDIVVISVEDEEKYEKWIGKGENKRFLIQTKDYNMLDNSSGRRNFLKDTGIRVEPFAKGMKIKMLNDLKLEKSFPFWTKESLKEISKRNKLSKK